jgi:hypothetical protein
MRTSALISCSALAAASFVLCASACSGSGPKSGSGGGTTSTTGTTSGTGTTSTTGTSGTGGTSTTGTTSGTGGTTASTSTGSGGSGGADCASKAHAECLACCGVENPQGAQVLAEDAFACACTPATCETECAAACSGSLDAGESLDAGAGCEACISGLLKSPDACVAMVLVKCNKDATCKAFVTCEEGCPP